MDDEKQNNINNNKKTNSFFKKVLISIKDFDKYNIFVEETAKQSFSYLFKIILIFSIILALVFSYKFINVMNQLINTLDQNIASMTYQDDKLTVNDNQETSLSTLSNEIGNVIINTADLSDEQIEKYKEDLNLQENELIFLKDKVLIKNQSVTDISELSYQSILSKYNLSSFNKDDSLEYYNNNKTSIYFSIAMTLLAYLFVMHSLDIVTNVLLLALLCLITARICKLKMTYKVSLNIAIHSLTLSILLDLIYIIINIFTGFTIKYFEFMYTGIAYVYIITAILMIRSDYIKRQADVEKIKEEQEKVRDELDQKEQERKDQEEKEKVKQKDKETENKEKKEKSKKKKENNENPQIGDKTEGSSV